MRTAQQIEENKEKGFSSEQAPTKRKGRGGIPPGGMRPNSLKNLVAPWRPGESANPSGLPGHDVAAKIVRDVFKLNEKAIYEGMAAEVIAGKPYAFDVAANRAYGKVKETVDVNVSGRIELATAIEERRKKKQERLSESADVGSDRES
jgi:hypothetical protein